MSLIGAGLLYWLTVGPVRGFAFYLGLSTVLDLVASYFFMRPAVRAGCPRHRGARPTRQHPRSRYGIPRRSAPATPRSAKAAIVNGILRRLFRGENDYNFVRAWR